MPQIRLASALALSLAALATTACNRYVTRSEFDATVSDLRGEDARLRTDSMKTRTEVLALKRDLTARFQGYDARITQVSDRGLRLDMTAQFNYRDTEVREADKPGLLEFAKAVRKRAPNAVVTVEGFTDPTGPAAYNKRLGLERAQAVREFLIREAGLPPNQVRAVSYGEDPKRLLSGPGQHNRRAALVVDYVPPEG